jgi:hypothetical protein
VKALEASTSAFLPHFEPCSICNDQKEPKVLTFVNRAPLLGAKVARSSHPNKEIEAAVAYAEERGWVWTKVKGHVLGESFIAPIMTERDASSLSGQRQKTPRTTLNN